MARTEQTAELTESFRAFLLSRTCLIISVLAATFIAVLAPGHFLASYGLPMRLLLNMANMVLFLVYSYYVILPLLGWALSRGLPLFWIEWAGFAPISALVAWAFSILIPETVGVVWMFSVIMAMVAPAVAAGLLGFQAFILPRLSVGVEDVAIWLPLPRSECLLQAHLPRSIRAKVLRMKSENQYLHVTTDRGKALIRLTLAEAENLVPKNAGYRLHRSFWVARDQIRNLTYENGNPKVVDIDGNSYPISRAKVGLVRGLVNRRR